MPTYEENNITNENKLFQYPGTDLRQKRSLEAPQKDGELDARPSLEDFSLEQRRNILLDPPWSGKQNRRPFKDGKR